MSADIHPTEPKTRSWGTPACGTGKRFFAFLRHDSAALARGARVGLIAKSCPDTCFVGWEAEKDLMAKKSIICRQL